MAVRSLLHFALEVPDQAVGQRFYQDFGLVDRTGSSDAVRLCPDLTIVPPNFQRYRAVSQEIFGLYRSVTPLVEPLSLDEAYLDVTDNAWNEPLAVNVARRLKAMIKDATSLTASAGVAPNKFLAKIASAWRKPDGLTVIAPERVESFLQRTGVGLSLGAFGISARLQLEPTRDPLPALHALLDLPLRLEAAGGYRALIAFDEF